MYWLAFLQSNVHIVIPSYICVSVWVVNLLIDSIMICFWSTCTLALVSCSLCLFHRKNIVMLSTCMICLLHCFKVWFDHCRINLFHREYAQNATNHYNPSLIAPTSELSKCGWIKSPCFPPSWTLCICLVL